MRYFLLPGFGEDEFCFRFLRQYLDDYSLIDVNYFQILETLKPTDVSIKRLAQEVIAFYDIRREDTLVGHSMGGYVGAKIHQLSGCRLVMIASFSDTDKIYRISNSRFMNYNYARFGGLKSKKLQKFLWDRSKNTSHVEDMKHVLENFKKFSNSGLAKSTIISFGPKLSLDDSTNVLRIHSTSDKVVRPPDEAFSKVKGGHFCLTEFPEDTFDLMKEFVPETTNTAS